MDTLDYKLLGSGDTSVIFLNGFRMHFNSWDRVYPAVAGNSRVLLINRAGTGSSPKAQVPQSGDVVVSSVRYTTTQTGMKPPFVLVCHSLGGIFTNLYARMFPSEVIGVVFVESPHPLEIIQQKKLKIPFPLGAINEGVKRIEKLFDPYKFSEDEYIHETLDQLNAAGSFPNVAVSVVTGAKKMPLVPQRAFNLHTQFQVELLNLSGRSRHFICKNSGHFPQITDSDVVVSAIEHCLDSVKTADVN